MDKYLCEESESIKHALEQLGNVPIRTLIIVHKNIVCGSLTDSDIRKAVLKGIDTTAPVSSIMNTNCIRYEVCSLSQMKKDAAS